MLYLVLSKKGYYCGMSMKAAELHRRYLKGTGPVIQCWDKTDVIRCIKMSGYRILDDSISIGRIIWWPLKVVIADLQETRQQLSEDKAALDQQRTELSSSQKKLQQQIDEANALIREYENTEAGHQALLDEAVRQEADAVIVHHGYFWKNESPIIRGMKRNRLKTLLANDINLYGYHLPLDAHPELGNNVQLAQLLGITVMGEIEPLVPWGELSMPVPGLELASWIEARLGRRPLWCGDTGPDTVKRVAWCTGGGQGFIDSAARFGVDAFITGEVSEQTIHSAREQGLHFYAAGHHATERGGIRALSEWLTENTDLDVTFIDIPNPA